MLIEDDDKSRHDTVFTNLVSSKNNHIMCMDDSFHYVLIGGTVDHLDELVHEINSMAHLRFESLNLLIFSVSSTKLFYL